MCIVKYSAAYYNIKTHGYESYDPRSRASHFENIESKNNNIIFTYTYVTRSDKKGLIARQILTIISRFEIL